MIEGPSSFGLLCCLTLISMKNTKQLLTSNKFWLLSFLIFSGCLLLANSQSYLPGFVRDADNQQQRTYQQNRFVALPAINFFSPDPDQLRIQDLRGIECYAQPDALEVCGAGDTIPIMLFTKSIAPLQDIRIDISFEDGIEYGGFAIVDNTVSVTNAQLDTISVDNVEAPSFLLDEVSQGGGGVVLYIGIRAECGVDFTINNPDILINVSYTNPDGVACMGELLLEDYGGNVIVPKVIIPSPPAQINLGRPDTEPCQSIAVTQSTIAASATGYLFTGDNYGFEDGIMIANVRIDGVDLDAADYAIDPASGMLSFAILDPTADGLLDFNETQTVQVCYTYTECFPNVDYFPEYTVVSACEGEFCTGPPSVASAGRLISNFSQNPLWMDPNFTVMSDPSFTTGAPYVFDITLEATGSTVIGDQMESINFRIRRCKNAALVLSTVQLVSPDGMTVLGTFDPNVYSVRGTDNLDNNGVPTLDRAGTLTVDLRINDLVTGSGLQDTDGDGFFDDIPGDESARIRVTYEVACEPGELICNNSEDITGGVPAGSGCQFREILLLGRTGCNARARNQTFALDGENLESINVSSYGNTDDFTFGGASFAGYDFDKFGNLGGVLTSSTKGLEFSYMLDGTDPFACDDPSVASTALVLKLFGADLYLQNIDFTNFMFDGMVVAPGDIMIDRSIPGELTLTVNDGDATPDMNFTYTLDATLDTAACAPVSLIFVDAFITTDCNGALDCAPVRTCQSTAFRVDSDSIDCVCTYDVTAEISRKNYDFTDESRTSDQDSSGVAEIDTRRFISGDTLLIDYMLAVREGANPDFNTADRFLDFRIDLRLGDQPFSTNERFAAMFDQMTARINSLTLCRADMTTIDIGASFMGPVNGTLAQTGVNLHSGASNNVNPIYYQLGEPEMSGFPNGGFTFGYGNSSADQNDGRILRASFRNITGEPNALGQLFDLIGGAFLPLDTVKMTVEVVLVDNPGWDGSAQMLNIQPVLSADAYTGPQANNQRRSVAAGRCSRDDNFFDYRSPVAVGESRIDYTDDCEAELVVSFSAGNIPDDWFVDEHRLVTGIEDVLIDIPSPYYYAGGATVETGGIAPISIEPDSSLFVDTVFVSGQQILYPAGPVGQLSFVDAERADGVRSEGYNGFGGTDPDLNDVTTVGGTFPLIGFQGGMPDSLVFRIPLLRVCSDAAELGLAVDFNAANVYLPDLQSPETFRINAATPFWTDKIRNNDGNLVAPIGTRYLPFPRLNPTGAQEISRERQTDQIIDTDQPIMPPGAITQSSSVNDDEIIDLAGSETNGYSLCPAAGESLSPGAIRIVLSPSVALQSISGDATSFSFVTADANRQVFAVEVPEGLPADECFEFDLVTDLLFCDAGMVCLTSIPGCPSSSVSIEQQVAVYDALMENCNTTRCYVYEAGSVGLAVTFDVPVQSSLCTTNEYSVLFANTGTGSLVDFMPILYLPEGLMATSGSFEITLLGGSTTMLTDPVATPDSNNVFGTAFLFDQAEINAGLPSGVLPPGTTVAITFSAETTCDFIDGSVLAAKANVRNTCQELNILPVVASNGLRVVPPTGAEPFLEFNVPDNLQVSCKADGSGTNILITTLNAGKSAASQTEIMFTTPDGLTIDAMGVEVLAPAGFSIDEITETDLGGGVTMYSFTGPETIGIGGALCLSVPVIVDGAACGVYSLSAAVKQDYTLTCASTMMECEVSSILSESPFLEIEVVPAVTIGGETMLMSECGTIPNTIDLSYELDILAPSEDYSGLTNIEIYSDVNANGMYEPSIDVQLGATVTEMITVDSGEVITLFGSFDGVDVLEICPILLRLETPGCDCGESIFPVESILPSFIEGLGESIALCPGETATIEGVCTDLDYSFSPVSSGFAVENGDGTVSYGLNPGFASGTLVIGGTFGTCEVMQRIEVVSPTPFIFGPFEADVCMDGPQQIDLNIPVDLQEDLEILISPSTGIDDPTSFEPTITDLQSDQVYTIDFSLPGGCEVSTTLTVTAREPQVVTFSGETGCLTGIDLNQIITVTPADASGTFQTMGDGTFPSGNRYPTATEYIPGPGDREAGEVMFRFITDDPDGPCGPAVDRNTFTILIVDCGNLFWNGNKD